LQQRQAAQQGLPVVSIVASVASVALRVLAFSDRLVAAPQNVEDFADAISADRKVAAGGEKDEESGEEVPIYRGIYLRIKSRFT